MREFECYGIKLLDDGDMEMIIGSLVGHSGITELDFGENRGIKVRGMAALAALLSNPNSSVTDLDLSMCDLDDENVAILAPALARCYTLRKLRLAQNGDITGTGWMTIFTQLQSPQSLLEHLDLWDNDIDNDAAMLLADVMANSNQMKILNLSECNIATAGWRAVFDALQSPRCKLQELDLNSNDLSWGFFGR